MEDSLVSSRISKAKKDAGVAVLESMGSTTSELINSAFDYVIEKRQLPSASSIKKPDKKGFARFVAESTLQIDWNDDRSYKDILRNGKVTDYESLA